ncbi:hypothetical protein D3C81_1547630 [compost metagenome]
MHRVDVGQRLLNNRVVGLRPRLQRRQPRRTPQRHCVEHANAIVGISLLLNHRKLLRNAASGHFAQALTIEQHLASARFTQPGQ